MKHNVEQIDKIQSSSGQDGTVGKALSLLDVIAAYGRPVRFARLLADSPFPKATLYRFLQTLTNQGMLEYDEEMQTYSLGLRLVRLAHAAWQQSSLASIARPHIDALSQEVGETVHLAQIDNGQVIFIDKRKATNQFETLANVGQIAPAYCTGVGKAMLAFMGEERRTRTLKQQAYLQYTPTTHQSQKTLLPELDEIRKDGVAYDREEHEQGIISIAAPILSSTQRVIGALSIATSTSRHSLNELNKFKPMLLSTAAEIGSEAQNWQFPEQPINQTA